MKRSIWKYQLALEDEQVIHLPADGKILDVQYQHGLLVLWALVNVESGAREPRLIRIFGTGNPIDGPTGQYIATTQDPLGGFVWHVFEGSE